MVEGGLGSFGREVVEMIDERLSAPIKAWTRGTWFFAIGVLALLAVFFTAIVELIVLPLWTFAIWLSAGNGFAVLSAISASMIIRTIVFFGMMVFLIAGGFVAVHGVIIGFYSVLREKKSIRQSITEELAPMPRWKRVWYRLMMYLSIIILLFMYVFMGFYTVQMFVHDTGVISELRAAIAKCLPAGPPPPPVQLSMPAGK